MLRARLTPPSRDGSKFATRRPRACRPGLDGLEPRRLLAISTPTINADSELVIVGNAEDDDVVVTREGSSIVVTDRAAGGFSLTAQRYRFDRNAVDRVVFRGNDGDDYFDNDSGEPTLAYGGDDDDTLYGTDADDILDGGDGNDELHGSGGDDRLYGGADDDTLFGGSGNDGLYGGGSTSVDNLDGGSGADRFLVQGSDRIVDLNGEDARLTFVNGKKVSRTLNGKKITFQAGSWKNDEVELIDEALHRLVELTGNTRLLKTAAGAEYVFTRLGTASGTYSGFNSGKGQISFAQRTFIQGDDWAKGVVWHEIGHSWQEKNAGSFWSSWLAESDWKKGKTAGRGRKLSTNKEWTYKSTAAFHRDYAKTSPTEDWGTTWEIALVPGSASGSSVRGKINVVNDFIDSLAT